MPYRLLGHIHATAYTTLARLRSERGQGTIEYVAIILLVATLFAAVIGVVGKGDLQIDDKIRGAIENAIGKVNPDAGKAGPPTPAGGK